MSGPRCVRLVRSSVNLTRYIAKLPGRSSQTLMMGSITPHDKLWGSLTKTQLFLPSRLPREPSASVLCRYEGQEGSDTYTTKFKYHKRPLPLEVYDSGELLVGRAPLTMRIKPRDLHGSPTVSASVVIFDELNEIATLFNLKRECNHPDAFIEAAYRLLEGVPRRSPFLQVLIVSDFGSRALGTNDHMQRLFMDAVADHVEDVGKKLRKNPKVAMVYPEMVGRVFMTVFDPGTGNLEIRQPPDSIVRISAKAENFPVS